MRLGKSILMIVILLLSVLGSIHWSFAIAPRSSTVTGTVWGTWTLANSPYYIEDNITIPYGETLIIEPGVEVLVNGSYWILVGGELIANGTIIGDIEFRSNGTWDGMGAWEGIMFNSSGSGKLENCTVKNATSAISLNNTKNLIINESNLIVSYTGLDIKNNSNNNLFRNCYFSSNMDGIIEKDSNNSLFINCSSEGNYNHGTIFINSHYNRILESKFTSNDETGLIFQDSSNNYLNLIDVRFNDLGVQINGTSANNTLNNSYIYYNTGTNQIGLEFSDQSKDNKVLATTIDNNAIEVVSCENTKLLFQSCSIYDVTQIDSSEIITFNGCFFYDELKISNSKNIIVADCEFYDLAAINSLDVSKMKINNCTMDISTYGIKFESQSNNISIIDCEIDCNSNGDGIYIAHSTDNIISNCTITDCIAGIIILDSNKTKIQASNISLNDDNGIFLSKSNDINIDNCEIFKNNNNGIQYYISSRNLINDCLINHNKIGLSIRYSSNNNRIFNTKFLNNKEDGCKQIGTTSMIMFYNCTFSYNEGYGLYTSWVDNIEMDKCKILDNDGYGIYSNIHNLTIFNSEISSNSNTGIIVSSGELYLENCTLEDNFINALELFSYTKAYLINTTYNNKIRLNDESKLNVGWFLDLGVKSNLGGYVPYSTIKLIPNGTDHQNSTEYSTDSTGWLRQIVCYEYSQTIWGVIDYNPYLIEAGKEGVGAAAKYKTISDSQQIILELESNDLRVNSIELSWPNLRVPVKEGFNITTVLESSADIELNDIEVLVHITSTGYYDKKYYHQIDSFPANSELAWTLENLVLYDAGKFTVTITIDHEDKVFEMNEDNNQLSLDFNIVERPKAVLEANRTSIFENSSVTFYGNKSSGPVAIRDYIFDFDDGSAPVKLTAFNKVEHVFTRSGIYIVSLQVVDITNIPSAFDELSIVVNERPSPPPPPKDDKPIANFTITPSTGDITTNFKFRTKTSFNKYNWDFGDKNSSTFPGPTWTYANDGIYTVSLTVEDFDGRKSEPFNLTLEVRNLPPVANLTVDKNTAYVGEKIRFIANQTYDIDDTLFEPSVRFKWYFGDTNSSDYTENSINSPDGTFDMISTFAYTEPDVYIVKLVVYDDDNSRSEASVVVTVVPAEPKYENGAREKEDTGIFGLGKIAGIDVFSVLIIFIIIIIFIILFLVILRKRSRAAQTAKPRTAADQETGGKSSRYSEQFKRYDGFPEGYDPGIGIAKSEQINDIRAAGDIETKEKKKPPRKKKEKVKAKGKKARTRSVKPLEVSVNIPEEKVVFWKDEASAQNHKLGLDDVDMVSPEEYLGAPMVGVDDEEEGEEFIEYFEPDEDLEEEPVDWDVAPEAEEFEELEELEEEVGEEIPDEEFEAIIEDEEETLVFEFEEEGETKSAELEVKTEEFRAKEKPKTKHKYRTKDPLIPIPGIGFVRRSELQRTLGIEPDEIEDYNFDDIKFEDIPIPDGEPLKLDDSLVDEPVMRCKWCDKPIKGKYIKFRRKTDDDAKVAIVGPFCSPKCANKFGK